LTECINFSGSYVATEKLSETHAAKDAKTAKGATCFRRESFQHLNQINKPCDFNPLASRDLSTGAGSCDCNEEEPLESSLP
jgi:hypothetical protein